MKKKIFVWQLTDPDSLQYGRYIGDKKFEFKETGKSQRIINLSLFKQETINNAVNSYGFSGWDDFTPLVKDWLRAECLFELEVKEDAKV